MTSSCCCRREPDRRQGGALCFLVPPDIIARVVETGHPQARDAALRTLSASSSFRSRRTAVASLLQRLDISLAQLVPGSGERRSVYDVGHGSSFDLPGRKVRGDNDPPAADDAVNEAFSGADLTYRFYDEVFKHRSIDGQGMEIVSSVHYGQSFDNALWNGEQMVYGDGSGQIMAQGSLTKAVDVIGHELTHGVTQATAGLRYRQQSGALNESFSDVFGSLVKQYHLGQTADQADWLIGKGILGSALHGQALRSLKEPGKAFDLDRQPASMQGYVNLPDDNDPRNDNGGVHVNSGIPNRAFYLAATALGGRTWERAGRIWYVTLTERLRPDSDFRAAAEATVQVAGELFGGGSVEQEAVRDAWEVVGVLQPHAAGQAATTPPGDAGDSAMIEAFLRGGLAAFSRSQQVATGSGGYGAEGLMAWSPTRYDSVFWCRSRFLCNPQSVSCLC